MGQMGPIFSERVRQVAESMRDMHAVPDLSQRRLRDVQEIQTAFSLWARKTFDDVRRNRVGGSPQLRAEREALESWKCFQGKTMELDEQVVRTLPRDEIVMGHRHRDTSG
jgi:hypothetical protein